MIKQRSHLKKAREVLPGGVNSSTRFNKALNAPFYVAKGKGSRVWDLDGQKYIDMIGLDGEFGHAHYNSSKADLILLTKTIALELAHLGIRANAVCPGYVRTAMNTEVDSDEFVEQFQDRYIPDGRVGKVTDIAPIFLFLASDDAEYINGQTFVLDGGQLAGQKPWNWLLDQIRL